MEEILVILFLLLILSFIVNVLFDDTDAKIISWLCAIICGIIFTIVLIDYISKYKPTALDVYQGKTTLEITYKDSIPVDSVVVFKEEFKK